jgi:hypothetical protein
MISPAKRRDEYSPESNAGDFRVKDANIFAAAAAADSGLIGVIAPTDKKFTVVDPVSDFAPLAEVGP